MTAPKDGGAAKVWSVKDNHYLTPGGNWMSGGCHHKPGLTACGGCYARAMSALEEVARFKNVKRVRAFVDGIFEIATNEGKKKRARRDGGGE